jgi:hypothetical protein
MTLTSTPSRAAAAEGLGHRRRGDEVGVGDPEPPLDADGDELGEPVDPRAARLPLDDANGNLSGGGDEVGIRHLVWGERRSGLAPDGGEGSIDDGGDGAGELDARVAPGWNPPLRVAGPFIADAHPRDRGILAVDCDDLTVIAAKDRGGARRVEA